jgi:hypothetical protein
VGGVEYPRDLVEFAAWFPDDEACADYLAWLRWGDLEFVCPSCGAIAHGWRRGDGRAYDCGACGSRSSVTAGTLFDRTRTPLTVWFRVAWEMTSRANGVSARSLQRSLGLGSYQTAWMMTHRYRRAMVMPGRAKLSGLVEVDETTVGGRNLPGHPGRSLHPNRIIVLTMVENLGKSGAGGTGKGIGRARLAVMPNYKAESINAVLLDNIEPGTKVLTDAYGALSKDLAGFEHVAINTKRSGIDAHVLYPAVSRVQAQLKRWLHGTHQGAVSRAHERVPVGVRVPVQPSTRPQAWPAVLPPPRTGCPHRPHHLRGRRGRRQEAQGVAHPARDEGQPPQPGPARRGSSLASRRPVIRRRRRTA